MFPCTFHGWPVARPELVMEETRGPPTFKRLEIIPDLSAQALLPLRCLAKLDNRTSIGCYLLALHREYGNIIPNYIIPILYILSFPKKSRKAKQALAFTAGIFLVFRCSF